MDFEKSHESRVTAQAEAVPIASHSNGETIALDPRVIRKLRLKIDFIILPTLAIMYTFK